MDKMVYQNREIVYRIYDPVAKRFYCSGRGLYASNGRSVWFGLGAAKNAKSYMPQEIQDRAVIKKYVLVEIESEENNG